MTPYHKLLKKGRPKNSQVQDARRRMNQGPGIAEAKAQADLAAPVGSSIRYHGLEDPPGGVYLIEDGRILQVTAYPDLSVLLGTRYNLGGEEAGTFRIPDSRGRTSVGAGQGVGLTDRILGGKFGAEMVALSVDMLAAHSHAGATGNNTHTHGIDFDTHSHAIGNNTHNHGGDDTFNVTNTDQFRTANDAPQNTALTNWSTSATNTGDDVHSHSCDNRSHSHIINSAVHDHSIPSQGLGEAHPNSQPSITVNYCIRVLP